MNIGLIEKAWEDRSLLNDETVKQEILNIIENLDCGKLLKKKATNGL